MNIGQILVALHIMHVRILFRNSLAVISNCQSPDKSSVYKHQIDQSAYPTQSISGRKIGDQSFSSPIQGQGTILKGCIKRVISGS